MATFLLGLLLPLFAFTDGAVEYYGKPLGPLSSLHHGISGNVFAVDARTIHIRDFNYDGEGPAAYFYAGNTKSPSTNGFIIRDEKGLTSPLKRYRNKHITITLPEGKNLHNIKWFSVWCEEFAVNFGDVKIPKNLDVPKPQKLPALAGVHGVSSEPVVVVDAQTLLIPSFSYDGEAPDAKFWVGRGSKPSPQGIRVPDENGKENPLRRYDRKTIVLTLPGDLTVFDIGHFGVWCEAFTVDFGHIQIGRNLNVPPSLKMLGVSPQKRSRSLQFSALQQSVQVNSEQEKGGNFQQQQQQLYRQQEEQQQQLQQRQQIQQYQQVQQQQQQQQQLQQLQQQLKLQSNQNSFNYENVLPLFNVQESLRPTTYRPQFLLGPNDHRFSKKQTEGYLPLSDGKTPPQQQDDQVVQILPSISLSSDEHPELLPPFQQFVQQQPQQQRLQQQIIPSFSQSPSFTLEAQSTNDNVATEFLTVPQQDSNNYFNIDFTTVQPEIQDHKVENHNVENHSPVPIQGRSFSRFVISSDSGSSDSFVQY